MHRIAALFVVILLVMSGGGNFADPAPVTPAPLLPLPGTLQPPDPLGGFRGLQPTPAAVTPSAPNASRFDLPDPESTAEFGATPTPGFPDSRSETRQSSQPNDGEAVEIVPFGDTDRLRAELADPGTEIIYLMPDEAQTPFLIDSPISIGSNVVIHGNNAHLVGNVVFSSPMLVVETGVSVQLHHVTIRNATSDGSGSYGYYGGAITNRGSLQLFDSEIAENSAIAGGGGINNIGGQLLLERVSIRANQAGGGAGIQNDLGGSVTAICTRFISNGGTYGGGILNGQLDNANGSVAVSYSVFDGNYGVGTAKVDIHNLMYEYVTLQAYHNWWGNDNNTPSVSSGVSVNPKLLGDPTIPPYTMQPQCQPQPPQMPAFSAVLTVTDGIPYRERIFALTVTNNSGGSISDLNVSLFPFTASPDAIPFVEPDIDVPFRYILHQSGPLLLCCSDSRAKKNNLTIGAGQTLTFVFTAHSKRSGQRRIDAQLTSLANSIDLTISLPVHTKITELDFAGTDSNYSAAIFWALFNETSEGNMFAHDPEGLQNCFQSGWTIPNQSADVRWVIRKTDTSEPRCRELLEMDIQVMLNGILRYERQVNSGGAYKYFTSNYEGSLGNRPPEGSPSYYQGKPGDRYTGSSKLWMLSACWPLGSEFGITMINNGAPYPPNQVGYRVVLESNQTIATLPANFNREAAVLEWLRHYLECFMGDGTGGDIHYQWQYAFYQQIYAGAGGQQSVIARILEGLTPNCSSLAAPMSLETYLACDPANGGIGRVSATDPAKATITVDIPGCVGTTPMQTLHSGTINFVGPFQQQMQAVGSPDYSGGQFPTNGYRPSFPTILLPVVFFSRDQETNSTYSVQDCRWETISYPQSLTPLNFPR